MRNWMISAVVSLSILPAAFGDEPKVPVSRPPVVRIAPKPATRPAPVDPRLKTPEKVVLKDGDTVVFLGDSITHQCLYTQYLEDFFYTRMPGVHIRFHNSRRERRSRRRCLGAIRHGRGRV